MQLGAIKPIKAEDWRMPKTANHRPTQPEGKDESAAQLTQIKWLMVALLLIILMKK